MIVTAYKCDKCGKLYAEDDIIGISSSTDMFDIFKSFPSIRADKAYKHYCLHCANAYVTEPAKKLSRGGTDTTVYDSTVRELLYILKKSLFDKKK